MTDTRVWRWYLCREVSPPSDPPRSEPITRRVVTWTFVCCHDNGESWNTNCFINHFVLFMRTSFYITMRLVNEMALYHLILLHCPSHCLVTMYGFLLNPMSCYWQLIYAVRLINPWKITTYDAIVKWLSKRGDIVSFPFRLSWGPWPTNASSFSVLLILGTYAPGCRGVLEATSCCTCFTAA